MHRRDVALGIVGVDVPVAPAATTDEPKQRRGLAFAGESRELVDGGDHEGRRQPVDLLVDREDRKALVDRATSGERAASELVAAVHIHSAHGRVGFDLCCGDRRTAPWATLDLQDRQAVRSVLVGFGQLLVGLLEALWAHIGADPQPDAKRFDSPGRLVL